MLLIALFTALINFGLAVAGREFTASLIASLRVVFDRIRDEELRKAADEKYERYKWDWDQQQSDRDAEPPDEKL